MDSDYVTRPSEKGLQVGKHLLLRISDPIHLSGRNFAEPLSSVVCTDCLCGSRIIQ